MVSLWRDDFSLDGNKMTELRWFKIDCRGCRYVILFPCSYGDRRFLRYLLFVS